MTAAVPQSASRDLPPSRLTGTVTFLFTDVESSTALWEAHPAWMATAHSRQEQILREAIAAHGGQIRQQIGDAFRAAFPTAPQALSTAVAAQRALGAEPWPQGSPTDPRPPIPDPRPPALRVRMALATGEATADEAALLRRLDALLPAGNGGQILLTAATGDAVRAALPPGVWLRDLSERQLKNLAAPAHVWQAVVPDVGDQFRPLRLTPGRPHNLPRQLTSFIGREREAAEVAALLRQAETRLVTLTGPGGTGKTRLSLQVAADVLDEYADGVWFVELAALTDPALVPGTISHTLGIPEQGGIPIAETLAAALTEKQRLLVLDNFEQVLPASPALAALLAAAPGLRVLVSSRAPLALPGETRYPVPPLARPDPRRLPSLAALAQYEAVRLFVERTRARDPAFALTEANAPAVAEICARLDALPLAIELAAARVAELGVAGVRAGLENRLGLLVGRLRGRAARQQTLRGAIAWSYDLLGPDEQQLFQRLAAFQAGATLGAVEAVCNAGGDLKAAAREGLEALVRQSLLQQRPGPEGEPRFWMLETIHQYARERLAASGEAVVLGEAHLAYFLTLAEEAEPHLFGRETRAWLDRLEAEYDDLRAALDWAAAEGDPEVGLRILGASWRFWYRRGHASEARQRAETLLARDTVKNNAYTARPGSHSVGRMAALIYPAASSAILASDFVAAEGRLQEALELATALGYKPGIAAVLHAQGWAAHSQGQIGESRLLLEESLRLSRQAGDRFITLNVLSRLVEVLMAEGDLLAAKAVAEESMQICQAADDPDATALALNSLGEIARLAGDYVAARTYYEESLAIYKSVENRQALTMMLGNLGFVAVRQNALAEAGILLVEGLALVRSNGHLKGIATLLTGWASLLAAKHQPLGAARILACTMALVRRIGATLDAADQREYDHYLALTRAQLSPEEWTAAWSEGEAMDVEQAMAYALEEAPDA